MRKTTERISAAITKTTIIMMVQGGNDSEDCVDLTVEEFSETPTTSKN